MPHSTARHPLTEPLPWGSEAAPFCIPEMACLTSSAGGGEYIPAEQMSRHFMFTGETGSGKTQSGIKPVMQSILRYGTRQQDSAMPCAALIIDPKHDLGSVAEAELEGSGRMVRIGELGQQLDFFEDFRNSDTPVASLMGQLLEAFAPQVRKSTEAGGENTYWHMKGQEAVFVVAELAAHIEQRGGHLGRELAGCAAWLPPASDELLRMTTTLAAMTAKYHGDFLSTLPSTFDLFHRQIFSEAESIFRQLSKGLDKAPRNPVSGWRRVASESMAEMKMGSKRFCELLDELVKRGLSDDDYLLLSQSFWGAVFPDALLNKYHEAFVRSAGPSLVNDAGNWFAGIEAVFAGIVASSSLDTAADNRRTNGMAVATAIRRIAEKHGAEYLLPRFSWLMAPEARSLFYFCDIAQAFLSPLADAGLSERIWLNPVSPPPGAVSIRRCVEHGRVMLYQPPLVMTEADEALGRVIKRLFFRATFSRQERRRGVAYICDEFQRFATGDPESGEQSFLDRCRAYRVICVLATQSVAAIRYALLTQGGGISYGALDSAVNVMLSNVGNKFFFRNTDQGTHAFLQGMIPYSPLFSIHVLAVRPLSSLRPGECYALLANGDWGRHQVRLGKSGGHPGSADGDTASGVPC